MSTNEQTPIITLGRDYKAVCAQGVTVSSRVVAFLVALAKAMIREVDHNTALKDIGRRQQNPNLFSRLAKQTRLQFPKMSAQNISAGSILAECWADHKPELREQLFKLFGTIAVDKAKRVCSKRYLYKLSAARTIELLNMVADAPSDEVTEKCRAFVGYEPKPPKPIRDAVLSLLDRVTAYRTIDNLRALAALVADEIRDAESKATEAGPQEAKPRKRGKGKDAAETEAVESAEAVVGAA